MIHPNIIYLSLTHIHNLHMFNHLADISHYFYTIRPFSIYVFCCINSKNHGCDHWTRENHSANQSFEKRIGSIYVVRLICSSIMSSYYSVKSTSSCSADNYDNLQIIKVAFCTPLATALLVTASCPVCNLKM